EAWRSQSWLADLLYSSVDTMSGLEGAGWVTAVAALATFGVISLTVHGVSKSISVTAGLTITTSVLLSVSLGPRPAVMSFLLFGLVVLSAEDRRLRWASPLILWIWASVHASFPVGIAYLGLKAAA